MAKTPMHFQRAPKNGAYRILFSVAVSLVVAAITLMMGLVVFPGNSGTASASDETTWTSTTMTAGGSEHPNGYEIPMRINHERNDITFSIDVLAPIVHPGVEMNVHRTGTGDDSCSAMTWTAKFDPGTASVTLSQRLLITALNAMTAGPQPFSALEPLNTYLKNFTGPAGMTIDFTIHAEATCEDTATAHFALYSQYPEEIDPSAARQYVTPVYDYSIRATRPQLTCGDVTKYTLGTDVPSGVKASITEPGILPNDIPVSIDTSRFFVAIDSEAAIQADGLNAAVEALNVGEHSMVFSYTGSDPNPKTGAYDVTALDITCPLTILAAQEPVDPEPTGPEVTGPSTTDPETTDPAATDPETTDPATDNPSQPSETGTSSTSIVAVSSVTGTPDTVAVTGSGSLVTGIMGFAFVLMGCALVLLARRARAQ